MRVSILHDFPDFQLISYGNGTAYTLANAADADGVFFQGDDAGAFRERLDALVYGTPSLDYRDALRTLWGEYADLAQPLERVA